MSSDAETFDEALEERKVTDGLVGRGGWSLVWLALAASGLLFWTGWSQWPGAALWSPLLVVIGIIGGTLIWVVKRPLSTGMQAAGLVAGLFSILLPGATMLHSRRFFSTDAAAFNQLATQYLLHGKNPYTSSMAQALLRPASNYWTYLIDGSHVTQMSYPAGAFVLQVPFMALGWHHELTEWIGLFAWLASGVFLFCVFDKSIRWLAVLIMTSGILTGVFATGGTDALFIFFFLIAAWKWDRFGTGRSVGVVNWIGPVALGIACSVKQTPWFAVPFFILAIGFEAYRRNERPIRFALGYFAIVAGVFALFNVPFILWNASAWFHGTILPFTQPLVADGQGLVTLALHGLTGGVVLSFLTVAGVLLYVALFVATAMWYPTMKRAWLFLLPVVLFVAPRSFSSYLVGFVPVALVAVVTTYRESAPPRTELPRFLSIPRWLSVSVVTVPLVGALVLGILAFSNAPLLVKIDSVQTAQNTTTLRSVTVTLKNTTNHLLTPHFMVDLTASHPMGFWIPLNSGKSGDIAAGATKTYTIVPPSFTWSPTFGRYWLVDVYTTAPNALSTSPPVQWIFGRNQS